MAEGEAGKQSVSTVPSEVVQLGGSTVPSEVVQLGGSTVLSEVVQLGDRFSDIRSLGYGSGGLIYSAQDKHSGSRVCIKKILFDDQRSCQQALREVKIIGHLRHENVIMLHDVLDATGVKLEEGNLTDVKSIFFVQDLLQNDLHQVIQSKQLVASHIQLLIYQLLRGLKYVHSANVLHRNLKPANLFVNCDTLLLKIGDFGTSRIVDPNYNHAGHLSSHVGSCWYRSPEALLSPTDYTTATDIWSVGCIIAECFVGSAVFQGAHELDQLLRIVDGIHLTETDWTKVLRVMPNKLLKNHPFRPRAPLRQKLGGVNARTLDLIDSLLTFDPKSRLSATEALQHPYFSSYSCQVDEPVAPEPFHIEHEVGDHPLCQLRSLLVRECSVTDDPLEDDEVFEPTESSAEHLVAPSSTVSSPAAPSPSTPPMKEETHTLDQIFKQTTITDSGTNLVARNVKTRNARNRHFSGDSSSVKSQNKRNIRPSHSMNIFDMTSKSIVTVKKSQSDIQQRLKSHCEDDEEKDIADCSPRKIREDLELGLSELMTKAQALAQSTETAHQQTQQNSQLLTVEIDQTENFKEYSQPSPKNMSPSDTVTTTTTGQIIDAGLHIRGQLGTISGAVGTNNRNRQHRDTDSNKEEFSKKSLKQEAAITMSRKLILDKIESEKDLNIERSRHHSDLTSEEFDELYRLPTDHLSLNRDLSNQSLKNRHLKNNRSRRALPPWRSQDRERLKEEMFLEGACGGYEQSPEHSDHSEPEDILHGILSDNTSTVQPAAMVRTRSLYDMDISLDVLPTVVQNQSPAARDPLSSPESPPSPNGGRSGARPKKSPKKQRAL